jgi:hypothetical protein
MPLHSVVVPARKTVGVQHLNVGVHTAPLCWRRHALVVEISSAEGGSSGRTADRSVRVVVVELHTMLGNVLYEEWHAAHIVQQIRLIILQR